MKLVGMVSLGLIFASSLMLQGQSTAKPPVQTTNGPCGAIVNGSGNTNNCYLNSPVDSKQQKIFSLRRRANSLANQIFDFVYARENTVDSWKTQWMAQALLNAMAEANVVPKIQNGAQGFQQNLNSRNVQTAQTFRLVYLPQLNDLIKDFGNADVDVSPLTRAIAEGEPRKIGLMLSVVGERIGKRPPFPRTLTELEARAIIQGSGGEVSMEVYADQSDPNSFRIAEILRMEFQRQRWRVNSSVYPLKVREPIPSGIFLILPSADLSYNFQGMIGAFKMCEVEFKPEVRIVSQPPTILKIEVWPGAAASPDAIAPPDLIVHPGARQ